MRIKNAEVIGAVDGALSLGHLEVTDPDLWRKFDSDQKDAYNSAYEVEKSFQS